MKAEDFPHPVEVAVEVVVHHSEDEEKVKQAVRNLFHKIEMTTPQEGSGKLVGVARDAESLRRIYEQIRARRTLGAVRRLLLAHSSDASTWLYFNKQAAYANVAVVCDEFSESPLGPMKLTIVCEKLNEFINWFAPSL